MHFVLFNHVLLPGQYCNPHQRAQRVFHLTVFRHGFPPRLDHRDEPVNAVLGSRSTDCFENKVGRNYTPGYTLVDCRNHNRCKNAEFQVRIPKTT